MSPQQEAARKAERQKAFNDFYDGICNRPISIREMSRRAYFAGRSEAAAAPAGQRKDAGQELDDCALLLRRLVRKVRAGHVNAAVALCGEIDDYLSRKGLAKGQPLRALKPNAQVHRTGEASSGGTPC